jgi:hypothetical protein
MGNNIHKGRVFLLLEDDYIEAELFHPDKKFVKGRGYIKDGAVYIYRGKESKGINNHGIYKRKDGSMTFVSPTGKERSLYSSDNLKSLNPDDIFNDIAKHRNDFRSDEEIEIINANREVFTCAVKPEDDFLKKIIKEAINAKQVNLNLYKDKFKNEHALNNMKSALNRPCKMSVAYFEAWCEVLGLGYSIKIVDNGGDSISRLGNEIIISSNI